MTREEYKAAIEETYAGRWDLHQVMLAKWDADHGSEPPAPVEPPAEPEEEA